MAIITIQKPITLSQNSSFENFGDILSIKKVTQVSVTALVSDLTTGAGTILPMANIDALKNTAEYSDMRISGMLYPRVKILSFDVSSGNLNKNAVVTIKFSTEYKNDSYLRTLSGYYVDFAAAFGTTTAFLDELSESVSLSRGENSASYSKQLSLRFNNSVKFVGATDGAINAARNFVQSIFNYDATNGYSSTVPDVDISNTDTTLRNILGSSFKKFRTEKINLITKQCSFSESLETSNVKTNYSHSATQTFSVDSNGVSTVSESGSVLGLTVPLIDSATSGYETEISNAETRLAALYGLLNVCDLTLGANSYTSISRTINDFEGKIDYSISATNDPRLDASSGIKEEREASIVTKNGLLTATENGTIMGVRTTNFNGSASGFSRYPAYDAARTYFQTQIATIKARVSGLIGVTSSPEYVERSESHSPLRGSLSYSITYSSEPQFAENDGIAKSFNVYSSVSSLKAKINDFLILNEGIIPQVTAGNYEGSDSFSCNTVGYRLDPSMEGMAAGKAAFLAYCKGKLAGLGDDDFLKSASYDFSAPNNVTFGLSCEYFNLG